MNESDYNARIETKLIRLHDEILSEYHIREKAKRDKEVATQIELVLRTLKGLPVEASNDIEQSLLDQAQEQAQILIDNSMSALNKNRTGGVGQGRLTGGIFRHYHGRKNKKKGTVTGTLTTWGGADIFEEELAAVIASIEHQALGTTEINLQSKLTGKLTANVQLEHALDKDMQKIMEQFISKTEQRLNREAGLEEKHYTKPVARAIKTDVTGTSKIQVTAQLNPQWELLYKLFQGKRFTVKNYSSYVQDTKHPHVALHLGDSDMYKAIYAVLSQLGYSQRYIDKVIFSGLSSLLKSKQNNTKKNATVNQHFYHMRFIYELQGSGVYDSEGNSITGADFFIYNDPATKNIYVRSTAEMILDAIHTGTITGQALGGISINKAYFM